MHGQESRTSMNIIVTGAASGIGCQVVTQLAQAGHTVFAADLDGLALARASDAYSWPATVSRVEHDVRDAESWRRLFDLLAARGGTLDAMVNVAGVLRVEKVGELRPESVDLQLDVNAKGVILGTQFAAAVMKPAGRGRIVNIASLAALAPIPGIAVYSASKFAVRGFSLAAAQELEPFGVHVSVVCPDAVATPMVDYQLDHAGAALTFSGARILTAAEVARAVVGLLEGPPRVELVLPWSRGVLAKISTLLPRRAHGWLIRQLTRKGLARQEALRAERH
jgi:NAD(P)-dependent dehydrogenase (short-subunit alcohol dehydrogenase family)